MTRDEVGRLARRLTSGLYVQAALLEIMRDPKAVSFAPSPMIPGDRPAGLVQRKDGTALAFDWPHHFDAVRTDPYLWDDVARASVVSALMVLGDALAVEDYFDHAPILEMVRHLRNGVGHGNEFRIDNPTELRERPAHTRDAACRSPSGVTFEITPDLQTTKILFEFMGSGDVVDVAASVGTHLLGQ